MYDISNDIMMLFWKDEPLWFYILRYVNHRAINDLPCKAPMAVGVDKKSAQFVMYYVPKRMEVLPPKHRKLIITHELMHIAFGHLTNRVPPKGITETENIAMDAAINSFFSEEEMPDFGIYPGRSPLENYPKGKAYEWYRNRFRRDNLSFDTNSVMDIHQWDELSDDLKHRLKQKTDKMLADSHKEASANGWGTASDAVKKHIEYTVLGLLNWRNVLNHFTRRVHKVSRKSSIKVYNKRYPWMLPGRKSERAARLYLAADQSGSMSDEFLGLIAGELTRLSQIATFFYVPFDTEVDEENIVLWKKNQKITIERTRQGGTDFQVVVDWAVTQKSDGLVFLTDMWAPLPQPSSVPRLWITNIENRDRAQLFIDAGEKVGFIDAEWETNK